MRKIGWLFSLLLVAGAAAQARAQSTADAEFARDWELRIGFFIPETDRARAAEGDVWIGAGAEKQFFQNDRYRATLSVDYYGSGKMYNIPVMINARAATNRFRYGAGAGGSFGHDQDRGRNSFVYNIMLGYELTQSSRPITFEFRYIRTGTTRSLNGWMFTIGTQI